MSQREGRGEKTLSKGTPLALAANMCLQKFLQEMGVRLADMTKHKHTHTLSQTHLCLLSAPSPPYIQYFKSDEKCLYSD